MSALSRLARVEACDQRGLSVQFQRSDGCSGCNQLAGCASRMRSVRVQQIAAPAYPLLSAGANIVFRIDNRVLGRIVIACYLLPALLLVCGALIGTRLAYLPGDAGAVAGAAFGLVLCGALLRLYDARRGTGLWRVEPGSGYSSAAMR